MGVKGSRGKDRGRSRKNDDTLYRGDSLKHIFTRVLFLLLVLLDEVTLEGEQPVDEHIQQQNLERIEIYTIIE